MWTDLRCYFIEEPVPSTFTVYNQGEPSNDHGKIVVTYNGISQEIRSHESAIFTYVPGLDTVSAFFDPDHGWEFDRDTNVGGPPGEANPGTRTITPDGTTNIHPQWDPPSDVYDRYVGDEWHNHA